MTTSRVAAAEDALLALLQADGTLAAIAGPPQLFAPSDPMDEHVWISEDSDETQDVHTTGVVPTRQEDFLIKVMAFTALTGNDYKAVRDRGVVLVAAIEAVIRTNFTLSGSLFFGDVVGVKRSSEPWEKRRYILNEVSVRCRSYI